MQINNFPASSGAESATEFLLFPNSGPDVSLFWIAVSSSCTPPGEGLCHEAFPADLLCCGKCLGLRGCDGSLLQSRYDRPDANLRIGRDADRGAQPDPAFLEL